MCSKSVRNVTKYKTISDIAYGIIYAGIGAAAGLLLNFIIMVSPLPRIFPAYGERFAGRLYSVDLMTGIFLYCLAAPVLEELIFRIGIYGFLYKKTGFVPAMIISSLLFAVYHMNMIQGIYAFIMGMLFCVFYHRDHRGYVPVVMHMGANLAAWLI